MFVAGVGPGGMRDLPRLCEAGTRMRSMVLVIGSLAIAACVEPGTVSCGDFVCASGSRCMSTGIEGRPPRCVSAQQQLDCEGSQPLATCASAGRCYPLVEGLACLDAGCGNGFVDPAEQCDDENNVSLDGCSGDCRSDETCGNGVIDPLLGERCDDHNHLSHDGCASSCASELPSWISIGEPGLRALGGHAVAYDVRRGRLVTVGGQIDSGCLSCDLRNDATMEWDGATWSTEVRALSPLPRVGVAAAYDRARGVVVAFGGAGDLADTWEWNGSAWRQRIENGPEGRTEPAMTYDARRRRVVLFGGSSDAKKSVADKIWEWDGVTWTAIPAGAVGDSVRSVLGYDDARGVTILATHSGAPGSSTAELWERTDRAWIHAASPPFAISELVFDPVLRRVLVIDTDLGMHTWDGALRDLPQRLPSRFSGRMATDAVHGKVLAFGGPMLLEWDGSSWTAPPAPSTSQPTPGQGAAATTDTTHRRGVLYGGSADSTGETWAFDGRAWARVATSGPGPSSSHAVAYRSAGDEVILFGGIKGTGLRGETWVWNETSWRLAASTGPAARQGAAMAYDPHRDRIVMFGGSTDPAPRTASPFSTPCACPDASTWQWDGTSWTATATGTSPPARRDAAMAYDPITQKVVMYGGQVGNTFANDTWTFDTALGAWHQEQPLASPSPRVAATLTWDAARGRLVLMGGFQIDGVARVRLIATDEIWEWDGVRWIRQLTTDRPTPRGAHAAFASPDGAGVVIVGGAQPVGTVLTDVTEPPHAIRWISEATYETCDARLDADGDHLAGCADPDCWARCTPDCSPNATGCPTSSPRCGDGHCDVLETAQICAADCGVVTTCGDSICDGSEVCSADCP